MIVYSDVLIRSKRHTLLEVCYINILVRLNHARLATCIFIVTGFLKPNIFFSVSVVSIRNVLGNVHALPYLLWLNQYDHSGDY